MRYSIYKNKVLKVPKSKKLNFNPDGRKYYVYRVTDLKRNNERHYYGSRISKKEDLLEDFWNYKTSSKYNILNENKKENYKVKILKTFNNAGDMIIYESFLHQYFDVKNNNKFWNRSNQTPWGFTTAGIKMGSSHAHLKGKKMPDDTKLKISNAMKNISKPHNNGLKISETKNKKIIKKDGSETTSAKEAGLKCSKTKNSKKWKESVGKKTIEKWKESYMPKSKEVAKKAAETKRLKAEKYKLIHIENGIVNNNITLHEARKLSQSLIKATKDNWFGMKKVSRDRAIRYGNANLIGLYLEKI